MPVDARTHYDTLLASVYTWMVGAPEAAREAARAQLRDLGIAAAGDAAAGARALDLGAGPGYHARALRELGYEVTALDTSRHLLDELTAADPAIRTIEGDLARADELVGGAFDVIVCLGDTLPHLASAAEVERALAAIARKAAPGARVALSFRDYVGGDGGERYLLVRGDADRVMTCRLETQGDHVACTDLVHERVGGAWQLRTSTYRKLRLDPRDVAARLRAHGFDAEARAAAGWLIVTAVNRPRAG